MGKTGLELIQSIQFNNVLFQSTRLYNKGILNGQPATKCFANKWVKLKMFWYYVLMGKEFVTIIPLIRLDYSNCYSFSMLLLNFLIQWSSNWKKNNLMIFNWVLFDDFHSMLLQEHHRSRTTHLFCFAGPLRLGRFNKRLRWFVHVKRERFFLGTF